MRQMHRSPPQEDRQATRDDSAPNIRRWRERELPEPSVIWQTVAIVFVGFAFSAAIGALTVPRNGAVSARDLWILAASLAAMAALCARAHWDVNRGRKSSVREVEELPPDSDDRGRLR